MLVGKGFNQRNVAVLLACLLGSLVLLSASSGPPLVSVAEVPGLEAGSRVRIIGLLVDARVYDSGAESLILADPLSHVTTKVISSPGIRPQPSTYASIGDELLLTGQVSDSSSGTIVFTKSDDVSVSRESEIVLSIEILAENWFLFENDFVRIKGFLEKDGLGSTVRLFDREISCSVALSIGSIDLGSLIGHEVLIAGTVLFDQRTLSLTLAVAYAMPTS